MVDSSGFKSHLARFLKKWLTFQEMGLFGSNIKKSLPFLKRKLFYNPEIKNFIVFPVKDLSSPNIKKILIFSQKKVFLIFPKIEPCTLQLKLKK